MKLELLMGRNEASGNIRKPAALGYSATAVTKVVASGIGPFFDLRQREKGSLRTILSVKFLLLWVTLKKNNFFPKKIII